MLLAKVLSRVVSTAKLKTLPSRPYLSVELLPGFGEPTPLIAIDTVQAGPGDTVLVFQEGTGAREVLLANPSLPLPAQVLIVGIVDFIQK
jgi:ethanolamine utilization protein EutN